MSHRHAQQFRSAHPAGRDNRRNPHFDQQGGTRAAGSIGAKASTAGPAVERDSDPPDLTPNQVVRVWKRNGELVVYEYKQGHRVAKLSYPVKEPSRNYYREGDILLVAKLEKRVAEREFPELKEPDAGLSAFDLFMMLLGEYEEEEYTLGWQILRVSDVGWGGGVIIVQGVIFFEDVPTALKKRAEFSVDELNTSFIYARTAHQLESLIPVIKFTIELSETLMGGALEQLEQVAAKRVLKESARMAMKRGAKKAFNRILRGLGSAAGKAAIAFLKAAAKEFFKDMQEAQKARSLKEHLGVANLPKDLDRHPIYKKAVLAGADAAALTFINEAFQSPMMKGMDKSFKVMYPDAQKTTSQYVTIYLSKEIVKLCTTEFASDIVDALVSAWKEALDASGKVDQGKFAKLVSDKLLASLAAIFTKRLDAMFEKIAEEVFEGAKS